MRTLKPAAAPPTSPPASESVLEKPLARGGVAEFHKASDLEKVFRLQGFKPNELVFVRIPHRRNSEDFVMQERNLSIIAREFGVGLMVFDETADWDALVVDANELSRMGLMRAPK